MTKPVSKEERLKMIDAVIAEVAKKHKTLVGEKLVSRLSDTSDVSVKTFSTGSLTLDVALGGGFPEGRVVEVFGQESSGKTTVALTAIGNVQDEGGNALFIDTEHAFDPAWAKKLGVDVGSLAFAQPGSAELALDLLLEMIRTNVFKIIVLDSVAALVPKAELEGSADQQTIGMLARIMSKEMRKIVAAASESKTTVVFINQERDQIGGFSPMGTPKTTTGGKALKYYASQRIEVKRGAPKKKGEEVIGNELKFAVKKNKIAPPHRKAVSVLTYGKGIDILAELFEAGLGRGAILRDGPRKYFEAATGELIGGSRGEAEDRVQEDVELQERLKKEIRRLASANPFDEELENDKIKAKDDEDVVEIEGLGGDKEEDEAEEIEV